MKKVCKQFRDQIVWKQVEDTAEGLPSSNDNCDTELVVLKVNTILRSISSETS